MLRHPDASSQVAELSGSASFQKVRHDSEVMDARRILLCSGKIGHELRTERKKKKITDIAITFVDQLYPFPELELVAELQRHSNARDIVWVQEEPANMGPLNYMLPRLRHIAGDKPVLSVKRSASPSPATGSAKAHDVEQKALLALALTANGH
jgi:2-oxoglutarate dehydrogenase E1 component